MKPNETQQDLLLDALSCIDDDVLAHCLALREAETAEKKPTPTDYLYDLSTPPKKLSPKKLLRAVILAAAILALLAVIPLSLWMVARRSEAPMPPAETTAEDETAKHNSPPVEDSADAPNAYPDETGEPGWEGTEEEETELHISVPSAPYTPITWSWNTLSDQNGAVSKIVTLNPTEPLFDPMHYGYTATVNTNTGAEEEFYARPISPEDELVLDLYAQYCLSLYRFDYGSHYLLFHPAAVTDRFTSEVQPYGYEEALGRIRILADLLLPYDGVSIAISLTKNELLAGEELTAYLDNVQDGMAEIDLSAEKITAVRRFVATGTVTVAGLYETEDWGYDTEFYCYEYEGVWYLADRYMDDDISIDLAQSEIVIGRDYLETRVHHGTVTDIRDGYIFLDDGHIFTDEDITTGTGKSTASVGDTVEIRYFNVGLLVKVSETEWAPMAPSVRVTVMN